MLKKETPELSDQLLEYLARQIELAGLQCNRYFAMVIWNKPVPEWQPDTTIIMFGFSTPTPPIDRRQEISNSVRWLAHEIMTGQRRARNRERLNEQTWFAGHPSEHLFVIMRAIDEVRLMSVMSTICRDDPENLRQIMRG